jgi:hypothetical protein
VYVFSILSKGTSDTSPGKKPKKWNCGQIQRIDGNHSEIFLFIVPIHHDCVDMFFQSIPHSSRKFATIKHVRFWEGCCNFVPGGDFILFCTPPINPAKTRDAQAFQVIRSERSEFHRFRLAHHGPSTSLKSH